MDQTLTLLANEPRVLEFFKASIVAGTDHLASPSLTLYARPMD